MISQASEHDTKLRNQEEAFEARLRDEQTRLQQTKLDLNQSNSKANEMRTRNVLLTAQNIMVWHTHPGANHDHIFCDFKCSS
jgi:hypothetical protein